MNVRLGGLIAIPSARVRAATRGLVYLAGVSFARAGNAVGLLIAATAFGFAGFAPVAAVLSYITLFTALIGSGLGTVVMRNVSLAYLTSATGFRQALRWSALWTMISGLVAGLCALALAYPASLISLGTPRYWPLFALAALPVLAGHIGTIGGAVLLGTKRTAYLNISNMVSGAILFPLLVLSAAIRSIEGVVYAAGAAALAQAAVIWIGLWRMFGRRRRAARGNAQLGQSRRTVAADWIAASLAGTVLTTGQFLTLSLLKDGPIGISATGLFSVLLQIINILLFIPIQFSGFFYQDLVRHVQQNRLDQLWRLARLVFLIGSASGIVGVAVIYSLAPFVTVLDRVAAFGPTQLVIAALAITGGTLNAFLVAVYNAAGAYRLWTGFIIAGTGLNLLLVTALRERLVESGVIGLACGYLTTAALAMLFLRIRVNRAG